VLVLTSPVPRFPAVAFVERRPRSQKIAAIVAAGAALLFVLARVVASAALDRWWFDTVTDAPVWSTRVWAQAQLVVAALLLVLLAVGTALPIAARVERGNDPAIRPRYLLRYHQRMGPAHRWLMAAAVAYTAWKAVVAAAGQWQAWLLFRHGARLSVEVPRIGGDLGFHLFRLPFLSATSSIARAVLLAALVLAVTAHFLAGSLRVPWSRVASSPGAVVHVGLLTTAVLAAHAVHEAVVMRQATATSTSGGFAGPGYTEVNATRPGLLVAALSLVVLGFVIVRATSTRRWRGVAIVAGGAAVVHLLALVIVPLGVERYLVAPAAAQRQLWSIDENLTATRAAYGLDVVSSLGQTDLSAAAVQPVVALFPESSLPASLQVLVGTPGTRITDVDLLDLPGQANGLVYTAARSSNRSELPERGWVQEHLAYTHGDGVPLMAADRTAPDGRPDLDPVTGYESTAAAPIYFGEGLDGWYAITGTRRDEVGGVSYDGAGISLRSFGRRLALALATGEPQPLFTSELTDDSVLLYRRGLAERLDALAPFLTWDSDPYPVFDHGRVLWLVDGYTTATTYPYSQPLPDTASGLPGGINYLRLAVRATVDAGDGTVHLYRADHDDDPVLAAWVDVFPGLFDDLADMPEAVSEQLRYPNDLFDAQTVMLGRYHVDDAETLFSGADRWSVSPGVVSAVGGDASGAATATDLAEGDRFATVRPFNPGDSANPATMRDVLAAVALAEHGADAGISLIRAASAAALGPQVAQAAIEADPTITQQITLLNANGSRVEYGPMTPIVTAGSVAWARSITVLGAGAASTPRVFGVAAVVDGTVGFAPTLDAALATATS
jgi:uncharacterized membrane protein (UPF0182 family)